jgi:hypothetical protein
MVQTSDNIVVSLIAVITAPFLKCGNYRKLPFAVFPGGSPPGNLAISLPVRPRKVERKGIYRKKDTLSKEVRKALRGKI